MQHDGILDIVFPDGAVNFVSTHYEGPTSNILVFEKCGIIDKLPSNCVVMADRGFKQIKSLLKRRTVNFFVLQAFLLQNNVPRQVT